MRLACEYAVHPKSSEENHHLQKIKNKIKEGFEILVVKVTLPPMISYCNIWLSVQLAKTLSGNPSI